MTSRWNDREAEEFIARYGPVHGRDVALRVYTSRLIGRDPTFVLHGGGNTSVKTTVKDLLGDAVEVLCVKGSGSDLADVEPAGLPAVVLAPLLRLRKLGKLSDEEMVNQVRIRLLDASAPNPSVETLLHAFVPERFVDHTHADAILCVTNQPDGEKRIREALGDGIAVLPWIMPGFPLAKAVADAYDRQPGLVGIVLLKHGIFTFGPDARTSYERMVDLVGKAASYAQRAAGKTMALVTPPPAPVAAEIAPVLRGALAQPLGGNAYLRMVLERRDADDLRAISAHPECRRLLALGPLTPDHVIRTKTEFLVLSAVEARDPEACRVRVAEYVQRYVEYFAANKHRVAKPPTMLDPMPRVVVVEGAGIFAFGESKKAASIAADIACHTLRTKALSEALGKYEALPPGEIFEMEYWSLEQAKLGKQKRAPLAGQVALVTGAAGAIGFGICESLLQAGAHVVLTDRDQEGLARVTGLLAPKYGKSVLLALAMDVTDAASVDGAFAAACAHFGGIDVVVPNAGIAYVAPLHEIDPERFRKVVDVNLTGTMLVLRAAARVFRAQRSGGSVIVQASKNVFDPGASFGAYSASKAGQAQLGKVAALELASLGVRVNTINADAVFGDQVQSGLWAEVGPDRMKARGLDPQGLRDYYKERSLLKVAVTPAHVGEAVVFFAAQALATTGATLPVDAGIPGAFPR